MQTVYYLGSTLYRGANAFLLGVWWCVASRCVPSQARRSYLLRSLAGLAAAMTLAEVAKAVVVWPKHPTFPSGHEAFGASLAVSLAHERRRWLLIGAAACAVLGWGLINWRIHMPADVVAGVFAGALPTAAAFWGYGRKGSANT